MPTAGDQPKLIIRPLGVGDHSSIRAEALNYYRREQVKVWTNSADLLVESGQFTQEQVQDRIIDAVRRGEELTEDKLPEREVTEYEPGQGHLPKSERAVKKVHKFEYVQWWASQVEDGILFTLWLAATKVDSQRHLTVEQIEERFTNADGDLDEIALERAAKRLGKATEGNSEAPSDGAEKLTRRQRRRRERERRRRSSK